MAQAISTVDLLKWLNDTLQVDGFSDYSPNGLQVQGCAQIERLVTGVTASQALIDRAIEAKADGLLVHHGWFWRGEDPTIKGLRRDRLAKVLASDLNLFAYHLPLDAHPQYGNNAQLGRVLGLKPEADVDGKVVTIGSKGLIWIGQCDQPRTLADFVSHIETSLARPVLMVGDPDRLCRRVAWCTGAAQGMFEAAIEASVDVYITGEISEPNAHLALESGVAFVSAGHHATERYGVKALGEAISSQFGIEVLFFDIDNPA